MTHPRKDLHILILDDYAVVRRGVRQILAGSFNPCNSAKAKLGGKVSIWRSARRGSGHNHHSTFQIEGLAVLPELKGCAQTQAISCSLFARTSSAR